jgi:hypothetical protein
VDKFAAPSAPGASSSSVCVPDSPATDPYHMHLSSLFAQLSERECRHLEAAKHNPSFPQDISVAVEPPLLLSDMPTPTHSTLHAEDAEGTRAPASVHLHHTEGGGKGGGGGGGEGGPSMPVDHPPGSSNSVSLTGSTDRDQDQDTLSSGEEGERPVLISDHFSDPSHSLNR